MTMHLRPVTAHELNIRFLLVSHYCLSWVNQTWSTSELKYLLFYNLLKLSWNIEPMHNITPPFANCVHAIDNLSHLEFSRVYKWIKSLQALMSKNVATKLLTIAMVMPRFCGNLYDPNSSSMKLKLFYELFKCRLWSLNIEFYGG